MTLVIDHSEYADLNHACADKSQTTDLCYFASDSDGRIKIGFSSNVTARMKQIRWRSGKRVRLLATAPGGRDRETAYHMQFSAMHLEGEWFERHPEILAEIDRLTHPQEC